MNTRLQVEHPITERVTGTDLVRAMVHIAWGEGLCYRQEDLRQRGWAIEYRIYAEDPGRNFAPSVGRVRSLSLPQGKGVRVDSGIFEGFEVPIHYDPMLAKLIVWGENRTQAIARSKRSLREFILHGPTHNIPFHLWALDQPAFLDGTYTTDFVGRDFDPANWLPPLQDEERRALMAAAVLFEAERRTGGENLPSGPVGTRYWRWNARRAMTGNR